MNGFVRWGSIEIRPDTNVIHSGNISDVLDMIYLIMINV